MKNVAYKHLGFGRLISIQDFIWRQVERQLLVHACCACSPRSTKIDRQTMQHWLFDSASAVRRHHPPRTHDLRSGSQDHHPSKNLVQKTICCNSTSNAPDDGRMYPKHVELSIKLTFHIISYGTEAVIRHSTDNPQPS